MHLLLFMLLFNLSFVSTFIDWTICSCSCLFKSNSCFLASMSCSALSFYHPKTPVGCKSSSGIKSQQQRRRFIDTNRISSRPKTPVVLHFLSFCKSTSGICHEMTWFSNRLPVSQIVNFGDKSTLVGCIGQPS